MRLPLDPDRRRPALSRGNTILKRGFDLGVGVAITPVILPVVLVMVAAARVFNGRGLFTQTRAGLYGEPFRIYKICSMRPLTGVTTTVTTADDPRITPFGRFLRGSKMDELPQLWNVLRGDMSFVGPRPDVPEAYEPLPESDAVVLCVRPGITGPASVVFRNEEELLRDSADPERYNADVLMPEKMRLCRDYIAGYGLRRDLAILLKTVSGGK